ncbi:MAG: ribonuclease D [archaeon]|nr:ribonuclease D [archaeon]
MVLCTYITTEKQLQEAIEIWNKEKILAIDIECENNLHHYGMYISLIQISTYTTNWVVDVIAISSIKPLLELFENQSVQKVFHDVSFDFRIINSQFNCRPKNVYDTQLAALFLGKEKVGLGSLLEEYFSISTEKKFQRVDWTRRPLSKEMLEYAIGDTANLLELKDKLEIELEEKGRLHWVQEECQHIENVEFSYNEQNYLDLAGARSLTPQQRSVLHTLFDIRKRMAQQVDKPVFMIMRNEQLISFAKNSPYSWKSLHGVHPIVRQNDTELKMAVEKAKQLEEEYPKKPRKRLTLEQAERIDKLTEQRNAIANGLGIKRHLLVSSDQILQSVVKESLDVMRPWQQELLKDKNYHA